LQAILKFLVSQNFKHKHQTKVNCKQVGKWFLPPRILNTKNQLQESWFLFFLSHDLEGQKAIARNLENRFVTGFQSICHQLKKQLKTLSIFHH
jgi:hypothetical protein